MSNSDSPADAVGGPVTPPGLDDLPDKLRVHALAKLLGRTSREVLAVLADLDLPGRSAQSSVERKVAEQVVSVLAPHTAADPPAAAALAGADVPVFGTEPVDAPAIEAAPAALAPLFAPPAPVFQAPVRRSRRRAAAAEEADAPAEVPGTVPEEPAAPAAEPADTRAEEPGDDDEDGSRRRRRRGRRGRGRGRGGESDGVDEDGETTDDTATSADESVPPPVGADDADEGADDADETADETDDEAAEDESGAGGDAGSRRRRRRRRRRGAGDEAADEESDPPNTVVRVRAPRERADDDGDGVQGVRGSTRLEAKRQRRRDGRDAGRRRVPILSEAEFLARRESVERSMVVRERGDRVEIGVLEDGVLVEHFVTGGTGQNGSAQNGSLVGNIYLGRVQNVLPSMEAAFVDIGRGRNAVLYAGEVDWDAAGLGGRARRIEQALSSGDSVLVQVTKDPVGHKGARLTTQISLAGRFLVYVPSGGAAGISRKLPDVERKRLKDLLREIVPSEAGVIIRTASEGVTADALERDVRRLQAQWEVVREKSEKGGSAKLKAPVLLYEEPDMLVKVIRDQFNEDFSRLVVSGDDAWETVSHYVGHVAAELAPRLHRHVGPRDVFEEYRIDEQLLKALDRKVWLPSGGTLVIDRTEAMTVVDVNTGKFTGSGGNLEETVTRNNLEAAEEIVRQLRLRDIGGIIVIDFIDMVLESNRDLVLRRLTECLGRDRTRHQVAEVTSLGLVQMTRKRVGGGLLEHFSTPCEHCRGRGVIVSTEPVAASGGRADAGERESGGPGGRRSRGRGRRDDASSAGTNGDRPRRLPDAIVPAVVPDGSAVVPDGGEAGLDVGAATPEPTGSVGSGPGESGARESGPRESGAVESGAVEPVTVEGVRGEVEEVVVERALAAERDRHVAADVASERGGAPAVGNGADPVGMLAEPAGSAEPVEPLDTGRPARRRGRVTRSAGAPAASTGDAPVAAVLTVSARPSAEPPTSAPPVATPEPAAAGEPSTPAAPAPRRRARRAASRPAGPPAPEGDAGAPAGGDPV